MSKLEEHFNRARTPQDLQEVLTLIWGSKVVKQVIGNSRRHAEHEASFLQLQATITDPLEYFDAVRNLFEARKKEYLVGLKDYTRIKHEERGIPYEAMALAITTEQAIDDKWLEMRIHGLYYPKPREKDAFELATTTEERITELTKVLGEKQIQVLLENAFDMACSVCEKIKSDYSPEEYKRLVMDSCAKLRRNMVTCAYRAIRKIQFTTKLPCDRLPELGLRLGKLGITQEGKPLEERSLE
ncbi:hypothetical protein FJZ17_00485 [Candidatus Pacearchaeota archaeon]|nr:hypothetical protein [Candidatus Pacearchaeota archaeon]